MALSTTDERDLILPLFSGIEEDPLWDTFLHRLLARTRAQRLHLFIRPGGIAGTPPIQRTIRAGGYVRRAGFFNLETFSKAGLLPFASLRPHRVYSLEETTLPESPEAIQRQHAVLEAASVAHARFIRIVAKGDHNAWLVLLHDRLDFGAGDSALLSSLAPHFAQALAMQMELRGLRLRATIAEEALGLIGVGQAIFDGDGHVVIADGIATEQLDIQSTGQGMGRAQLRAGPAQALSAACRDLATAKAEARRTVRFDDRAGKDILLRRVPPVTDNTLSSGYSIGLVRQGRRAPTQSASPVVAATLGLSTREAALAEAISQGRSIVEAGAQLQLTPETARNYSKRIYAKTGASGQADLVRMILTGLEPFA
ncbi:MAG: LuxR C-terminal-related transcriptional regulator [Novosphingobium sp.]